MMIPQELPRTYLSTPSQRAPPMPTPFGRPDTYSESNTTTSLSRTQAWENSLHFLPAAVVPQSTAAADSMLELARWWRPESKQHRQRTGKRVCLSGFGANGFHCVGVLKKHIWVADFTVGKWGKMGCYSCCSKWRSAKYDSMCAGKHHSGQGIYGTVHTVTSEGMSGSTS